MIGCSRVVKRGLQTGFVGLPNVGKSTLFNVLVGGTQAEAQNFPFCTIEANVGFSFVPDRRLSRLAEMSKSEKVTEATLTYVDVAGLVEGASEGQGLGNQFLADIRNTDAIVHVIRCFDKEKNDIIHVLDGDIDPVRDVAVINNELLLADLGQLEKRLHKIKKKGEKKDIEATKELIEQLENGVAARETREDWSDDVTNVVKTLGLITAKPMIYAANVGEDDIADPFANEEVRALRDYVTDNSCVVPVSAQLECELNDLDNEEERSDYLDALGITERDTAKHRLTCATNEILQLQVFYTTGDTESRAWQCRKGITAPSAAGIIHTDFEKKFIRAECVSYDDLISFGSMHAAKENGRVRAEGKDYVVCDGDVMLFRHGA
eukprot:g1354.t1